MKSHWKLISTSFVPLLFFLALIPASSLKAQSNEEIEVYLDFRHRGVINQVIISYYKDDTFFLPVSELFTLFGIDHTIKGLVIEGKFGLEQVPYRIDFVRNVINYDGKEYSITVEDYILKELDSYLECNLFYEIFGLDFTIDFNNLALNLETLKELPTIAAAIRNRKRRIVEDNRFSDVRYDLRFDRQKPFLDGGFIDYNLSSLFSPNQQVYTFNTDLGIQLAGGDLQGTAFGNYTNNNTSFFTDNLRWRYLIRNKPWISHVSIGQRVTDGLSRNNYTGIRISNEPIEPRRLFDEFEIQGNTIPESEVELYLNNALVDFQQADALGNYRFLYPITYGSSLLDLKIYGPTGQVIERSERIQIPFSFQPQGAFNYIVNAGQLENPLLGSVDNPYTVQATGSYGITEWLTAEAGVEYFDGYFNNKPTFSASVSSRLLSKYIVTLEAATEAFYRANLNVIYPNSASLSFDYTEYQTGLSIYNPSNNDRQIIASAYYPFNIFGLPLNLRASTFTRIRASSESITVRFDANSRIGRMGFRVGFTDRYNGPVNILNPTNTASIETSATYTISRNRTLPAYLRGAFFRAQMRYQPALSSVQSAEFLLSQNVLGQGRVQVAVGRNFISNFNLISANVIIDFNKIRSSSTFNSNRGVTTMTQNFRGSVGYDTNYNNFLFTSRDQVGRAATAVKLFVDNDDNGVFEKDIDTTIEGEALRVLRSGAISTEKNGVLYFSQMQPYFYYNAEVNKGKIFNPLLVPQFDKFGLITDPNRFKKVEVPFYMSGVIEGVVQQLSSDLSKRGIGGLKLILNATDSDYYKEIRTFSDGGFYEYEVPPGNYELYVDRHQLNILNVASKPDTIRFEVKAISEGDFIEGLNFDLVPVQRLDEIEKDSLESDANIGTTPIIESEQGISINYNIQIEKRELSKCRYGLQLGAYSTLQRAWSLVNESTAGTAYVLYNERRQLYAVRSGLYQSLAQSSIMARNAISELFPDVSVVNQCYGDVASSFVTDSYFYHLQFGAFSTQDKAEILSNRLLNNVSLETYLTRDTEDNLYKVRIGPFHNRQDALAKRHEILNKNKNIDIFITQEPAARFVNVDFDYHLLFGEFESNEEAAVYAARLENSFQIHSKIVIDERDVVTLISREAYTDWDEVLRIKNDIQNRPGYITPVIQLIEKKL